MKILVAMESNKFMANYDITIYIPILIILLNFTLFNYYKLFEICRFSWIVKYAAPDSHPVQRSTCATVNAC